MKNIMVRWGVVLCAIVVVAQTASGQCSSKSLNGTFGYIAQGAYVAVSPPLLAVISGVVTYDGAGNNFGEGTTNLNGWGGQPDTFTGTQTVYPDCTFEGQHTSATTGDITHFRGTIAGNEILQEIHFIVTDPFYVAYGTDYKISPKVCSLSTLKGPYAFSGQGTITADTPPSLVARVGIVTYDGAGNFVGKATMARNGVIMEDSFTGTYGVDANCKVSLEITGSVLSPVIHEVGRITRGKEFQEVDLIITDPGFVYAEAIRKQ